MSGLHSCLDHNHCGIHKKLVAAQRTALFLHPFWYAGGVFQVKLTFTDDFNCMPPAIHFITVPFHPNGKICLNINIVWMTILHCAVDPSNGIPSIHLLSENGWHCINGFTEDITVASILLRLQVVTCTVRVRSLISCMVQSFIAVGGLRYMYVISSSHILA